jgi:DNA-binding NarL/FixJ family response regulator
MYVPARTAHTDLTKRELRVVRLVANGKTNTDIAFELEVSYETIKSVIKRIRSKIGAGSRTEVATWAGKNEVY